MVRSAVWPAALLCAAATSPISPSPPDTGARCDGTNDMPRVGPCSHTLDPIAEAFGLSDFFNATEKEASDLASAQEVQQGPSSMEELATPAGPSNTSTPLSSRATRTSTPAPLPSNASNDSPKTTSTYSSGADAQANTSHTFAKRKDKSAQNPTPYSGRAQTHSNRSSSPVSTADMHKYRAPPHSKREPIPSNKADVPSRRSSQSSYRPSSASERKDARAPKLTPRANGAETRSHRSSTHTGRTYPPSKKRKGTTPEESRAPSSSSSINEANLSEGAKADVPSKRADMPSSKVDISSRRAGTTSKRADVPSNWGDFASKGAGMPSKRADTPSTRANAPSRTAAKRSSRPNTAATRATNRSKSSDPAHDSACLRCHASSKRSRARAARSERQEGRRRSLRWLLKRTQTCLHRVGGWLNCSSQLAAVRTRMGAWVQTSSSHIGSAKARVCANVQTNVGKLDSYARRVSSSSLAVLRLMRELLGELPVNSRRLALALHRKLRSVRAYRRPPKPSPRGRKPRRQREGERRTESVGGSNDGESNDDKLLRGKQEQAVRQVLGSRDHYGALQLDRGCSQREVKTAFRRLARLIHPDKSDVADTQKAFVKLQEAHGVLSNDVSRAEYDAKLDGIPTAEPRQQSGYRHETYHSGGRSHPGYDGHQRYSGHPGYGGHPGYNGHPRYGDYSGYGGYAGFGGYGASSGYSTFSGSGYAYSEEHTTRRYPQNQPRWSAQDSFGWW